MMLRLIGAVMILISSAVMGAYMAGVYGRRVTSTEEVTAFIKYIKRNIESFKMPVGEILSSYTSPHFEETGFLDALRADGLESAIKGEHLTLSAAAERELLSFASRLGGDYTDGEIKRCEYYIGVFEKLSADEKESMATTGRLYRLLPPLGAVSLIILLI